MFNYFLLSLCIKINSYERTKESIIRKFRDPPLYA